MEGLHIPDSNDSNVQNLVLSDSKQGRNSNFEVLRIIAMALIILTHCCTHNTVDYQIVYQEHFFSGLLLQWAMVGRLGVALFIMIFGYYGVKHSFNTKRLINLIVEVLTYSIVTYLVISLIDPSWFSISGFVKSLLPIATHKYWFISAYVIFYLFTPLLNKGLRKLSRTQFLGLVLIMVVLWSLAPTISFHKIDYYSNELVQFLLLYCIGAFMSLHCKKESKKSYRISLWGGYCFT